MDGIRREGNERHRQAMASHEQMESRVLDQQRRDSGVVIGEMDRQSKAAVNLITLHIDKRIDAMRTVLLQAVAFASRGEKFDPHDFDEGWDQDL